MSIHVMNYDRHPTDVDFFEYGFQGAVGLWERAEVFLRVSPWYRNTAVSLDPIRFPIPPLDLFVDVYPTPALREEPYFVFAPEVPFKSVVVSELTGNGAFASSNGDNVVGFKWNLTSELRGDRAGAAVRSYVEFPTEDPSYNVLDRKWRVVAGVSGEIDYGFEFLFSKRLGRVEVLANAGYKRIGDPDRGLRVQYVDSSQSDPADFLLGEPIETGLDLPDEVRLSTGLTVPLVKLMDLYWWGLAEFNYKRFVGSHTPIERVVHPAEIALGIQYNVPWYPAVSVGAAWQLLLSNAGDGDSRTSSFVTPDGSRGDINFSPHVDADLAAEVEAFLNARGATFSEASSRVFSTNNPAFDPWRNIPVVPGTIRAEGPKNILGFMTWHIGTVD